MTFSNAVHFEFLLRSAPQPLNLLLPFTPPPPPASFIYSSMFRVSFAMELFFILP